MKRTAILLLSLFTLLLVNYASSESETEVRHFKVKNETKLVLTIPKTWSVEEQKEALPTLKLEKKEKILLMFTFFPDKNRLNKALMKKRASDAGLSLIKSAVEDKLTLRLITGKQVEGYYFQLTDKAPKAGEFVKLTQGFAHVNKNFSIVFTILSNSWSDVNFIEAFKIVETALSE